MRFMLEIELDNDAMQTYGDTTARLREVANYIRSYRGREEKHELNDNAPICDIHGNTVGRWQVTESANDPIDRMYEEAFAGDGDELC